MKRIVYTRPDGGVSIVIPAPQAQRADETEADFLTRVRAAIPQDARDVTICEDTDIPADRTFRNAWTLDPARPKTPVGVDMPKARDIHMTRIREARAPEFARLDGEWMRATGQNDAAEAARIEAERQTLRDLPQTLDLTAAATADELKAIWPGELAG